MTDAFCVHKDSISDSIVVTESCISLSSYLYLYLEGSVIGERACKYYEKSREKYDRVSLTPSGQYWKARGCLNKCLSITNKDIQICEYVPISYNIDLGKCYYFTNAKATYKAWKKRMDYPRRCWKMNNIFDQAMELIN